MFEGYDCLEEVLDYEHFYPVGEWLMENFKKRINHEQAYFGFAEEFARSHIAAGCRKYGETESEWGQLQGTLAELLRQHKEEGRDFPHREILILLDQALLLEHEGHAIPNLIRG
ncbi:MAG: hypothetical protein E7223_06000 [Clostridiales bacterium]|nr:hypothetical protein [Clostridiales bacterium]